MIDPSATHKGPGLPGSEAAAWAVVVPRRVAGTGVGPPGAGTPGFTQAPQAEGDTVLGILESFYESTAQSLRPWAPSAPRLRPVAEQVDAKAGEQGVNHSHVSTAASSQDGPSLRPGVSTWGRDLPAEQLECDPAPAPGESS